MFGDDKSSDDTKKEIMKLINSNNDFKIKYYEGPGVSKAQNVYKGFEIAKGDILVIHDADNTVSPNELNFFLNTLVEKIKT